MYLGTKNYLCGALVDLRSQALSGVAWNSEILIAARLLQGGMAALMVPQVMSLMQVMYKPHERGQIMGIFGALAGVAASLGPVIGGILIHFNIAGLDWRPIFLINTGWYICAHHGSSLSSRWQISSSAQTRYRRHASHCARYVPCCISSHRRSRP